MTEYSAIRDPERCPAHPGAILTDILEEFPKSRTEVAKLLGISRQHLYDVLGGRKPVSPVVAAKVGKMFGGGPAIWLRTQANYDAWHAAREVDVSAIPKLSAA